MKTIVLINLIVSLVNAGVVTIIWQQYKKYFNGLIFLMIDMILQFTGFFLIALRGIIPDLFSIVFGVTFMITGAFFCLAGAGIFF
jgi:hypothetical protein